MPGTIKAHGHGNRHTILRKFPSGNEEIRVQLFEQSLLSIIFVDSCSTRMSKSANSCSNRCLNSSKRIKKSSDQVMTSLKSTFSVATGFTGAPLSPSVSTYRGDTTASGEDDCS